MDFGWLLMLWCLLLFLVLFRTLSFFLIFFVVVFVGIVIADLLRILLVLTLLGTSTLVTSLLFLAPNLALIQELCLSRGFPGLRLFLLLLYFSFFFLFRLPFLFFLFLSLLLLSCSLLSLLPLSEFSDPILVLAHILLLLHLILYHLIIIHSIIVINLRLLRFAHFIVFDIYRFVFDCCYCLWKCAWYRHARFINLCILVLILNSWRVCRATLSFQFFDGAC